MNMLLVCRIPKCMLLKHRGTLGPNREQGDIQEIAHLNRIVRWCVPSDGVRGERIELEADPRHVEIMAQQLNLAQGNTRAVSTPGTKAAGPSSGDHLNAEDHELYRSLAMRGCYLAIDRPEIQFACKELARHTKAPCAEDLLALKRLTRFLIGAPRCIWSYVRQGRVTIADAWSDADWAGCLDTRRSTSCTWMMAGLHLLSASATTQNVISTSSGESEFYALTKSASRAIGGAAMAKDLAIHFSPRVLVDATASKGIASRRGVGRVRHLHTQVLWVQEAVADRHLRVEKVPGHDNVADCGTKHLAEAAMQKCLRNASLRLAGGRSDMALRAATVA